MSAVGAILEVIGGFTVISGVLLSVVLWAMAREERKLREEE